jgi:energy-coupling factor transporter ATP-binding protein EcfA2
MEILNTIKPKTINEFVGNKIAIKNLKEAITQCSNSFKFIVVNGPNGCGKSTLCNILLKSSGFQILDIQSTANKINDLESTIKEFATTKTISQYFSKKTNKIIFFDNFDILLSTDRCVLTILDNVIPILTAHNVSILAICRLSEHKKMQEMFKSPLKPGLMLININNPSPTDAFVYLANKELGTAVLEDDLLSLSNKYRGCIRDIVLNIHSKDDYFTLETTFRDMNQFEIVKKLCRSKHTFKEIEQLANYDIGMTPFILYENIIDELNSNYNLKDDLLDIYDNINYNYLQMAILEKSIFQNKDWALYDLINTLRVHSTCLQLDKHSEKRKTGHTELSYRFSQMISKVSHRNILNKKMKSISNAGVISLLCNVDKIGVEESLKKYSSDEANIITTYRKYFLT